MRQKETLDPLIPLGDYPRSALRQNLMVRLNDTVEYLLSVKTLKDLYYRMPPSYEPSQFLDNALKTLQIRHNIDAGNLNAVPLTGPTIVVANHPFGGIDGIILASLLCSVRKDVKILANYMLGLIPDLRPLFILVDPFKRKGSVNTNKAGLKASIRWLKDGGMLVIFPAGAVSHFRWQNRKIEDPKWSDLVARLVRLTKASVMPVYFKGHNSILFHLAGLIHPALRTILLPREISKKQNKQIYLKLGSLIPYKKLASIDNDSDLTAYLRFRTYLLRNAFNKRPGIFNSVEKKWRKKRAKKPLVAPQKPQDLAEEIAGLPDKQLLGFSGELFVYMAYAGQIPKVLREIGLLREITFRGVGEGTGKSIDLDLFDEHYIHLFIWNRQHSHIVGAYRLGSTDEIVGSFGKTGLYTYTLFKYRDHLLKRLGPALELSRSFVRQEYQKNYAPLQLLWKGISQFVVLHPQYKVLFGAVSISNDYKSYSRRLMVAFLKNNVFLSDLSKMVRPRKAYRHKFATEFRKKKSEFWPRDIVELSSWVSGIEPDGKGIPILLKQYLKLGGKLLSFNIDPCFGNVLDGLIMVDLTCTEPRLLRRYMGTEGYAIFASYHKRSNPEEPCFAPRIPAETFAEA